MEFFPNQRSMNQEEGFHGNNKCREPKYFQISEADFQLFCVEYVPGRLDSQGAVVEHLAGEPPDS